MINFDLIRKIIRPSYRRLRRLVRFAVWVIPSLIRLVQPEELARTRMLMVYDTSSQPFSIGDLLLFQEASLILCEKHGIATVDVAIVYDPTNPGSSNPVFKDVIVQNNILYHLASILPVVQVNQNLGSVFIFNSVDHLQKYIIDNSERYHVWPSGWKMAIREHLSPDVFNDLLHQHHNAMGSLPHLNCRPFLLDWAEHFYASYLHGAVPVTVNIRNNKAWHTYRNSKLDCWLEFFDYCKGKYDIVFVIICARAEIDERWRACSNVVVAKDHHTGVEQDLALIHTSAIHLGAGSGPATMAWFNDKPYLMVNTILEQGDYYQKPGMVLQVEKDIQRFWFATEMQRIAGGEETTALLIREFALMWTAVDREKWRNMKNGEDMKTWLR